MTNKIMKASIEQIVIEPIEKLCYCMFVTLIVFDIYPPDMQKLATETVLKQAELLAAELTS